MPSYAQCLSFVTTVQLGTVTAAASALDVATSTVSNHNQTIEARLEGFAFARVKGLFVPTELGERFLAHANAILTAHDELREEFPGFRDRTAAPSLR